MVVDRGMAYPENLQEIRDRKLHYVVAARQPERDQWLDEFEDEEGFEVMPREPSPQNPFQKKSLVRVKAVTHGEETDRALHQRRVARPRTGRFARSRRGGFWRTSSGFRGGSPAAGSSASWRSARRSGG